MSRCRISGKLELGNHSIIELGGDLAVNEVLFDLTGTDGASFAGGGNSSQLSGIILSPNGKVTLSPGLVTSEIISGKDVSIVSGAQVVNPIPLPPAIWLLGTALLGLAGRRQG